MDEFQARERPCLKEEDGMLEGDTGGHMLSSGLYTHANIHPFNPYHPVPSISENVFPIRSCLDLRNTISD